MGLRDDIDLEMQGLWWAAFLERAGFELGDFRQAGPALANLEVLHV